MDPRREQLVRLLNRRRRLRLMLVCAATALACGLVAGVTGPQILIGGTSRLGGEPPQAPATPTAAPAGKDLGPLDLGERIRLDPREVRANAIQWQTLTEDGRRAVLDRYWRLAEWDEAERQRLFDQYAAFRELPQKRQEFLRARAQKLRDFIRTLSPQDQAVLESMGEEARARRILELWQARYGTW